MKNTLLAILLILSAGVFCQPLAFPGAEGCGKFTTGGRGGRVLKVTNLNDEGQGSLRWAIAQEGPRIIVFEVDGTIELKSRLSITNDSITIAGQSAPGDGICIKGYPFYVAANNVIIRYLRFRLGDEAGVADDAVGGRGVKNMIIDHCSASWSVDECMSFYGNENTTVQWCIISHSLYESCHEKGHHGFGGIWGGKNASFHHNLIADHSSRNPRFASDGKTPVDFRNNAVFNWGYKSAYGAGKGGRVNVVANYYKPGPATSDKSGRHFLEGANDSTSVYYVEKNFLLGCDEVNSDNTKGVHRNITDKSFAGKPFKTTEIKEHTPEYAFQMIMQDAGASLHRDSYDKLVIKEVKTGKCKEGDTYGKASGIIDSQKSVGGWPRLKSGKPLKDSDNDGMPDKWELANKLDPNDASDAAGLDLHRFYTNIEVYLNGIVAERFPQPVCDAQGNRKPTYYICGDSTVKNSDGSGRNGQWGWGSYFGEYIDSTVMSELCAIGGRSSRTFITEGRWNNVCDKLLPGDYVLIQFGHNDGGDMAKGRARASVKGTGEEYQDVILEATNKPERVYSYGHYLRTYINEAKAKGAIPVIISLVPRNRWTDGKIDRDTKYAVWAKEVAEAENVYFVDLHNLIADKFDAMGQEAAAAYFHGDHTHTSDKGARQNIETLMVELKKSGLNGLK